MATMISRNACINVSLVTLLLLGMSSRSMGARQLTKIEPTRKQKDSYESQGAAYSYSAGNDPGGPGDAFTWINAEASAAHYNGLYYKDGSVTVEAGDKTSGGWAGAISKNAPDAGTTAAIATNFDPEYSFQRGVHTISGTYEGARAVAGSGSMFGAAKGATITATIDAYAPTPQDNVAAGDGRERSVAHTNLAPNSAAQSGTGNGPAAVASGWEVAAAARAARDKTPPVTLGSRQVGDKGHDLQQRLFSDKASTRRLTRRQLLTRGMPNKALMEA